MSGGCRRPEAVPPSFRLEILRNDEGSSVIGLAPVTLDRAALVARLAQLRRPALDDVAITVLDEADARAIPHRLRHPAVLGAASSLNVGEGFDLVAPHVPTPLLNQIDQLPFTFQHTLLEQSEGFARVEILRTA